MKLRSRSRTLETGLPCITGVLNVTPDSFYAGSRASTEDAVLKQAERYLKDGADVLEIGGESTGPSSHDVSIEEERSRVLPAITTVRKHFPECWITIDTWKADVAKAALEAGADILNDVTAGRGDARYFSVAAAANCPIILMYSKDNSARTTIQKKEYEDVVSHVHDFLLARIDSALKDGISRDAIIIDPGLGHFVSSDPQYSYELLSGLQALAVVAPVLVSPSRKSFLAGIEQTPVEDRLPATIAASCTAVCCGAVWIRTHDVCATKEAMVHLEPLLKHRFN